MFFGGLRRFSAADEAYDLLEIYRDRLGLPDHVVERGREVFDRVKDTELLKYRGSLWVRAVMAASIYIACRESGIPVRFKDFELESSPLPRNTLELLLRTPAHQIARAYNKVVELLDLKTPRPNPHLFLRQIAERLGLDKQSVEKAEQLVEEAVRRGDAAGMRPATLAAAAVYVVCGERLGLQSLEKASGVSRQAFKRHAETLSRYVLE
ncbi:MAG: transcription initiation factor IIB family protein [Candidatus Bathyarchaeia archaeon]